MTAELPVDEAVCFDSAVPIAVFLGPSLDQKRAASILPANYYPPVRMGDVYRLIGSGVRLIVVIDGVFHRWAPVWPREILDALRNGITVVGASSMGALRAAELHRFGMIGHGTIFEWYRDGIVDGDDEVALNHGDAESGYRALSVPLVNMRATLADAVRAGRLTTEEAAELLARMKRACYAERSWRALLAHLPEPRRTQLQQYVDNCAVNLKEQDAIRALEFAAGFRGQLPTLREMAAPDRIRQTTYHAEAALRRGFPDAAGRLVAGRRLLAEASKDAETVQSAAANLARRFFLLRWAREHDLRCPDAWEREFRARRQMPAEALRANGLTPAEHELFLAEEALLHWMRERGPEHFGLRFDPYRRYVEAVLPILAEDPPGAARRSEFLHKAADTCFLADWARGIGFSLPPEEVDAFVEESSQQSGIVDRPGWLRRAGLAEPDFLAVSAARALYHFLGARGPGWFGFESWSIESALLRHLQVTGAAARLVAALSPAQAFSLNPKS